MELDSERKELLLKTLMELGEDDFKAFKFFTDLPQRVLGTHSPVDIAYELVKKHGEKTLEETIKILEKIGNKNLAEMLRRNMLEIRGAVFSVHDDNQIARLKADLQGNLQSLYSFVPEGNTERWQQQPLADVYTELDVTYGADVRPNERHEVLQMETRGTAAKESILPCDIFKSHDGKERPIRTLLTVGFAGIGKTFLVQKFVCDWASGNTNQDVHFIFPFTFRELNMDEGKSFTLAELIRRYVCESRHMSEETLNEILANLQTSGKRDYESSGIKILFVLDGLDECKFKMDLKNQMKVDVDVKKAYPLEVLLAHLIKRNLLPCARVWITTRPATARDIPSDLIDSRTEVRGFSDYQRLAYFRKKFPNEERVIEHIRKTRTIFIMCHLPIFCWLTATVLQDHLDKGKEVELPTTLTDMYSEYILNQLENSKERLKTEYISDVKALAKLAFHHTMSNRQIFYEKDLADSGFDYSQAAKHCGIFTQVFKEVRPLRRNQQGKMFQFIHLTIQEYLAAFYVIMSLFHDDKNVLADSELGMEGAFQEEDKPEELEETESEDEESEEEETEDEGDWKITEVHQSALQKASESKGNLDLFLRFLIGLSLPCNQELVGEMLKAPKDSRQSKSKTVKLIKEQIKRNTPENNINLFYCLNELKDDSLLKQFQKKKGSKKHLKWHKMPNAMWSALVFFLLTDDKTMRSFDLSKYASSPLGLEKLLVAVKASQESVLIGCHLDKGSCHLLASVLSSPSNLRHLDLYSNNLSDEGVEILSKGLASPHCILQFLGLSQCQITEKGCISLAEALKLNPSHLQELDLSHNNLSDEGVEIISKGLASPNCILQILGLKHCKITKRGCVYLAEALTLNPSHLQELHLCGNDLSDKGVEILSKEVASPHGILKVLKASWCRITKNGCVFLAEALKLNFYLRELHLEGNNLSDEGVEILSKELATTHCILKVLKLEHCKITKRGCVFLAEVLQINPSHLQELDLSCNDLSDEGVKILLKGLASPHCILQVLKLRKCGITKRTCVSLAEALKLNPSHLQELDLSSNDLSDEGVEILLKGLTSLHCILQVLKLDTCNLDKGSCHLLASVLSSPSNLRHLDLSCNDLSDEGVEILSKGLASPHCILQVFEMSWCKITNKGCVSLAKAYKSNPSHLQQLHIMCNPLGEKGKRLLIDIQEDPSYSLTTVKLDSCNLDKGSCHLLASVLSFPSKLRHLDLRHNNLSDEGVEILSKGLANPHCFLQDLSLRKRGMRFFGRGSQVKPLPSSRAGPELQQPVRRGGGDPLERTDFVRSHVLSNDCKTTGCRQYGLKAASLTEFKEVYPPSLAQRRPPPSCVGSPPIGTGFRVGVETNGGSTKPSLWTAVGPLRDDDQRRPRGSMARSLSRSFRRLSKSTDKEISPRVIKPTVFESLKGQREDRKDKTESLWTSLHNPHLGSLLVWYFWASIALVLKACSFTSLTHLQGGRMALDSRWKELLLKTLMELGEDDFEYFKFYTDLPTSVRENARRVNIADKLVMKYGAKTLDETIKILEKIDNKNLAEMLRRNMLEIKGAVFSVHDEDQIARLKVDLQGNMRSSYSFVPEGNTERWKQQQPLADVYSDLDITYGADVSPDKRHEVLQMETCATAAKESILPCDIFQSPDGKQRPIRTLLTVGFAGIGKTFLLQKFVWDWASGNTNQDIHFIFPFTFRELNTDKGKSFTLAELIRRYVCESRHMSEETLNEIFANLQTSGKRDYESSGIKILFVFDGLDECNFKIDLKNEMKVDMDVTQACPLEVLLAHLIKRNLLPCARVWITTRPTTAHDIPSNLIDSRTEVKGFSDSQRLEYFRKRFPNEERVTKHIRKSRTIFIMCHLPIFCWLTATVLQDHLDKENEEELPTTLTDMLSEYALNQFEKSNERQMTEYIHYVKALAKLAFDHTMSNQQIFFEKQLVESGFDYSQAAKHCGIFTEVLKEVRPLRRNQQGKMFQFVHLTIQEYLAAFYVMMSLFHDNKNVLADSDLAPESEEEEEVEGDWKITEVHRSALQRASECEGNLDLFVRFLFGLSLPCNQELLGELLKVPRDFRQSKSKTVKLIKKTIRRNTPEKNVNLFYCLNELKDDSLLKHIQEEIGYRSLSWIPMTNEMWSALAFFLLTDEETMKSFDLRKYDPSPLALEKLLVVVKASEKSVLFNCDLNKHSCHLLASLLSAPSNLRQLVLTLNNLSDEGVEILSKGLASPHCLLQVLVLDHCGITARGCVSLAGALKLHPSQLQEMRLSNNELSDEGVEILSKGLASPHCIIKVLELEHCSITKRGCVSLAEALKLNPSHLQELDLSYNNLSDDGVDILSKGLASPHCILQVLNLSNCNITKRGCISLAEALKFNRSHLQELRLSHNDLSDEGVEILSKGLASQHCILQILELSWCKITNKGCVSLAEALKLNPSHLQQLILVCNPLGEEGKRVLMDVQQDPSYGLMTVRS
ncbi:uncharacterized protein LOC130904278 [Corythoichthys intestinalis]|uniref:uncharacterized protein LOC130904278 n=1 Tax=Corythoichthys intestinalis TaxID=161448 RepID=UPI0025A50C43|nr:uncharacterized protein LOC130904278 [Corythoichthys intestinalis]